MNEEIKVCAAKESEKEIIRNLLEKYLCELSQYDGRGVNAFGLYGYRYLDNYWTEKERRPFLIYTDGKIAGFALVGENPRVFQNAKYSMNEFYILPPYRRKNFGTQAVNRLFEQFRGLWEIACHPKNAAANAFWEKLIDEYTDGDFTKLQMCGAVSYPDGSNANAWCFSTL